MRIEIHSTCSDDEIATAEVRAFSDWGFKGERCLGVGPGIVVKFDPNRFMWVIQVCSNSVSGVTSTVELPYDIDMEIPPEILEKASEALEPKG